MATVKLIKSVKCFEGWQQRYQHESDTLNCTMNFSVFLPPGACTEKPVPVIYWLSGLTCSDENFVQKAGAQQYAAEHGVVIVAPDTSPRGDTVPDDPEGAWDFGLGAGFYLDAVQAPWSTHYQMYSYITEELPALITENLPVTDQCSIMGHSMGGHGALTIAIKNPQKYQCVSAFSPICAPMECPWGQKAFSHYLGDNQQRWREYDTCFLLENAMHPLTDLPIWIEQGSDDEFLSGQLMLDRFEALIARGVVDADVQRRSGYDHSYFFISSFIKRQIENHVAQFR